MLVRVWSQFETPISNVLLRSGDIATSNRDIIWNRAEILMFLGRHFFLGGGRNVSNHILQILVIVQHVAKFSGDHPSDLWD